MIAIRSVFLNPNPCQTKQSIKIAVDAVENNKGYPYGYSYGYRSIIRKDARGYNYGYPTGYEEQEV